MAEIRINRRHHLHTIRHATNTSQQVNRALETPAEQPRPCQKQVSDAGGLEVEGAGGTGALDDLEVEEVEEGADEFFFRGRDVRPKGVAAFDDVEPFQAGLRGWRREAVVEEGFYGVAL